MLIYYFSYILIGLTLCMLFVGFFTCKGGWFAWFLGIGSKKETIQFIAYGMGGIVAAIVATGISRRADAQMRNNELIEKGHANERFQNMTANLGHDKVTVRVATFYRFYYLALREKEKEKTEKLGKNIFEMLCAYLRAMPNSAYAPHPMERQTLFSVLFKDKFKSKNNGLLSDDVLADLQNINFSYMDLSGANLSHANLTGADLSHANLSDANLSHANLTGADLSHANLSDANLSDANLTDTNLSGADLTKTQLLGANLEDVLDISQAYFHKAKIGGRSIKPDEIPKDKGTIAKHKPN